MKKFHILLAVFLVLVMIFSLTLSVLAMTAPGEEPGDVPDDDTGDIPDDDTGDVPDDKPDQDPPSKGNNGFGNGDQDAPGHSGNHNNAENARPDRNYPGKSGH